MSTFILEPNDTIIMNDSIVAKATKTTDACQTYVNEIATNWADVEIVKYICLTVVLIALIVAITVYLCHRKQIYAEQEQKSFDNEQKRLENEQKRQIEKEKYEESKKNGNNTTKKTDSDHAINILKEISTFAKDKDSKTDYSIAKEFYTLYNQIKNEIKTENSKETNNNEK